jgi:hypothetical protein
LELHFRIDVTVVQIRGVVTARADDYRGL